MKATQVVGTLAVVVLLGGQVLAQEPSSNPPTSSPGAAGKQWAYSLTVGANFVLQQTFYLNPVFTANRKWLHLEARYNSENQQTGSAWIGYNFNAGHKLTLQATPMIGGVFGRTTGIAPGYEITLSYKQFQLSAPGEYVFDTSHPSESDFYSWPQITYSPSKWFSVGWAAQHTKAVQTKLDIQRGPLVSFTYKKANFMTYLYNLGWTDPLVVLQIGVNW